MANEDEVLEEEQEEVSSDEEVEDEDTEDDVEDEEEQDDDSTDEDFDDDEEEDQTEDKPSKATKQNKNANKYYKQLRLQGASKEDVERKAYQKGLIEAVGGINPYTDEKIEDEADIQEYLTMKEIEKAGKDPIQDYHKWVKEKERKAINEKAEAAKVDEFIKNDSADFDTKYPDVDRTKLMSDENFIDLYGESLGKVPLATLYEKYTKFMEKLESQAKKDALDKKIKEKAKEKSSVGDAGKGKEQPKKKISELTDAEFDAMLEKARHGDLRG